MTPKPHDPSPPTRPLDALGTALEQSHDVKAKVEAVAGDLQQVTRNLAHGVGEVKAVEQALIRSREALAVMFLDLDRFKLVNDTHGHAAGDSVLAAVAQRLKRPRCAAVRDHAEHRHRALPRSRPQRRPADRERRRIDVPGQAAAQPARVLRGARGRQVTRL